MYITLIICVSAVVHRLLFSSWMLLFFVTNIKKMFNNFKACNHREIMIIKWRDEPANFIALYSNYKAFHLSQDGICLNLRLEPGRFKLLFYI